MNVYDMILRKKRGEEHTRQELACLVRGITDGSIPDYQISAWAMAVCFRGMSEREAAALTDEMAHSGDVLDLSPLGEKTVDKHSTGGVGDKTTLLVAPIVAAAGGIVAKMSGRGLGHTGGTVDKLESIPGYRVTLSNEEFFACAERCGLSVIGQSGNLTPADKKLYALRDVTGTVDSLPLIASSIMSKKLAAGARSIVLDVKYGDGAFFKTQDDARDAARLMLRIGRENGRRMSAVLSSMEAPLGYAVGNLLEVREACALLSGAEEVADLRALVLALSGEMLALSLGVSREAGLARAEEMLDSGAAWRKFLEWVEMQGGDPGFVREYRSFPTARCCRTVTAAHDGYFLSPPASEIGMAALLLGAGRAAKEDEIDPTAGILLHKKPGDPVAAGEPIFSLFASSEEKLVAGASRLAPYESVIRERRIGAPVVAEVLHA